jgi:hypothetical protein
MPDTGAVSAGFRNINRPKPRWPSSHRHSSRRSCRRHNHPSHRRTSTRYPDFRFHAEELDGIHRAWSDGSVEWVPGNRFQLTNSPSPDLRIVHLFGNYYF